MKRLGLMLVTILTLAGLIAAVQSVPQSIEPLLSHSLGAIQPRISPDGKSIAVSYQGSLWTIPQIGGVMTRLTSDSGFDIEPAWSPDGESIAFVNSARFAAGEMRIISRTGKRQNISKRIEVTGTAMYYKIEWLDAERLLSSLRVEGQNMGIGWANWKTGESKTLIPSAKWNRYGASTDGRWLAYTTSPDQPGQQMGNDGCAMEVWKISTEGGEPEKLFRFPSRVHDLCWSADNAGLFIVAEIGGSQAHYDLWYVPLREPLLHMRKLTYGQADEDRPSISRDGRWLVYTDNQRGPTSIVARDLTSESDNTVPVEQLDFGSPTGRLKVNVFDCSRNESTTARVSVVQIDGKFSAPPGSLYRVFDDIGHFYCDKSAEWTLPAGKYRIRAFHGLEYRPLTTEVEVAAGQRSEIKLDLERWTDLPNQGWHSGENHIHANYGYGQWYCSPQTMRQQSEGEGIEVSNFMVSNSDTDGIYDREYFTGRPDRHSTDRTLLYWNQEFRSTIWGHMTLVNLKQVVEPIMTGFKETTNPWDIPTNSDIADRAHIQMGLVNYTHVAQNPEDPYQNAYTGKGIPIDVALGKIDTLDLNSTYEGTLVLWHRLLNCGFRLPASAGTDCFLNRVTSRLPGADRVYVKFDGPLDYGKWIDGLRAGRSFVTNGPMLEFSLGNHQLGDTINLDRPKEMIASVKAESHFPMSRVEVIYNGKVVATVPLNDAKQKASTEIPIKIERSGWLALRAAGPKQSDQPTASLDAHTSPIYVEVVGTPSGSRQDAEYFLKWIDRLALAIRLRDRIPNDALRRHVEDQFEAARAVYLKIAESDR